MRRANLEDCSREVLEAFADGLERDITAGREDLRPRLEAVRAQIPHAPLYCIDHKPRHHL